MMIIVIILKSSLTVLVTTVIIRNYSGTNKYRYNIVLVDKHNKNTSAWRKYSTINSSSFH